MADLTIEMYNATMDTTGYARLAIRLKDGEVIEGYNIRENEKWMCLQTEFDKTAFTYTPTRMVVPAKMIRQVWFLNKWMDWEEYIQFGMSDEEWEDLF